MPICFDGSDFTQGALPLLTPYHYSPHAPVTGMPIAFCLDSAYLYSRAHARLIGVQTYRYDRFSSFTAVDAIRDSDFVAIGEFRATLPPHATFLQCTALYAILDDAGAEVHHQLVVRDAATEAIADSGTDMTSTVQKRGETENPVINLRGYTVFDYAKARAEVFTVERSSTLSETEVVVTAYAYALEDGGLNPVAYRPYAVICEWATISVEGGSPIGASALAPLYFCIAQQILAEDLQEVSDQLNEAARLNPVTHCSMITGGSTWWAGGTGEVRPQQAEFPTSTGTWEVRFQGDFFVDDDTQTIFCEAGAVMPSATTGSVRFRFGDPDGTFHATSILTSYTAGGLTRLSDSTDVSTIGGTGWRYFDVSVRRDSGSGTGSLRDIRLQDEVIALVDLPPPSG